MPPYLAVTDKQVRFLCDALIGSLDDYFSKQ